MTNEQKIRNELLKLNGLKDGGFTSAQENELHEQIQQDKKRLALMGRVVIVLWLVTMLMPAIYLFLAYDPSGGASSPAESTNSLVSFIEWILTMFVMVLPILPLLTIIATVGLCIRYFVYRYRRRRLNDHQIQQHLGNIELLLRQMIEENRAKQDTHE